MDTSDFVVQFLVTERLAWAREQARRRALAPPRESLRVRLGVTLIALGRRLVQEVPIPRRATP